jgi:ABC-type multidrug transport system ATPase subunit/predicted component of type VI protein secretion system
LAETSSTIGRASDADVRLLHPTVSQHHARVSDLDGSPVLTDLGSSNGTRLNGADLAPREPQPLHDGDRIEIGPFELTYATEEAGMAGAAAGRTMVIPGRQPARLTITSAAGTSVHPLTADAVMLGRDSGNDIVVPIDAVSRRHARIERRDGTWRIVDLDSVNGLRLDGRKVPSHDLRDGDVLMIGRSVTLEYSDGTPGERAAAAIGEAVGAWEPGTARREVEVPEGAVFTVGRGAGTDLAVDHPQASRAHARVERRGGRLVIHDLGSAAGTFVNGQRVADRELLDGDVVRIASRRLSVREGRLEVADEEGALTLRAEHLSVTVAKGKCILDDVSLVIRPGEFVAVIGASGSGKSTLLNALSGFRPATAGAVTVNEVGLYANYDAYRTELGYVPQDDIIHLELPVTRALEYAARLRMPPDTTETERSDRIREVLRELDLSEAANTPIRQLSGGQRKRVSIAVELLTRPSLFFLDEATSGLDPATESQLMRLLRRLADQGRTIVLVTHATKNVMLCDNVVVMARGGRLAYAGPPDEALRYFEVKTIDDIYERLEARAPEEWGRRWSAQAAMEASLSGTGGPPSSARRSAPGAGVHAEATASVSAGPARRRVSSWREFVTLSRRYLDIIMRDRKSALLLLLIAPILGALDFIVWDRGMFDPTTGSATKVITMFFIATLITVLVGTVTSVREIVKEGPIYRRERMVGVRVLPYVASKVAVGSLFAIYSAVVLYVFMLLSVDFSHLTLADAGMLFVPFVLGTFSGLGSAGLGRGSHGGSGDAPRDPRPCAAVRLLRWHGAGEGPGRGWAGHRNRHLHALGAGRHGHGRTGEEGSVPGARHERLRSSGHQRPSDHGREGGVGTAARRPIRQHLHGGSGLLLGHVPCAGGSPPGRCSPAPEAQGPSIDVS